MKIRPRIGAVSYLNTRPLVEGLPELADAYELVFDLPSRLADRLHRGDLDVALIPSIELVKGNYTVVSDACIGCRGEVWSVKLMSRLKDLAQIKSVALDEGSRTSCVLARILLAHRFGVYPQIEQLTIDEDWRETSTDATLIIGDRAMKATDPRFPVEMDLGESWFQWTNLSFVFAVWAARESERFFGNDLDQISHVLNRARDAGLANIKTIARAQAAQYGLTVSECRDYLGRHLHFTLGTREKLGMAAFFDYAKQSDLIPDDVELAFHATTAT